VIEQLDGYELAAAAWEHDVLPARVRDYTSSYTDMLCLSGRVAWGRMTPMDGAGKAPLKSSPIALLLREHAGLWRMAAPIDADVLTSPGRAVYDALRTRGASFFHELVAATGLLRTHVERALGELAGVGIVTADSFSGLRALLTPSEKRKSLSGGRPSARRSAYGVDTAGRWALIPTDNVVTGEERAEAIARALLKRYGVVFRALLARESRLPTWRELVMVYRRLDGVLTPDARVTAIAQNRVLFRDGVAVGAWEGAEVRRLAPSDIDDEALRGLLSRRASVKALKPHFRTATERERQMLMRKRGTLELDETTYEVTR
jgi:ATP-dependent Lhr-like helicase